MNRNIIKKTEQFVRSRLSGDAGHDWHHIERVRKIALCLAKKENANAFIVELAALLHDIGDWKFHRDDKGAVIAEEWLDKKGVDADTTSHVCSIIANISYKGAAVPSKMPTIEGKVVQDADRLDAIGAIGIARTFSYGGFTKREMFNPQIKPRLHRSFDEYKSSKNTTINHFYEKLLLLKDLMNTKTARKIAERRHKFMEQYLKEFFNEWDGKDIG